MLIDLLAEVHFAGMPIQEFVTGLNRHLRNTMIATVKDGLEVLEINEDLKSKYIEAAKLWDLKDLLRISKVVSDIEPRIKKAVQPHILLELTLLRLLEFDTTVNIQSILEKLPSSNKPVKNSPAVPANNPKQNITFKPKVESAPKIAEKVEKKIEPKETKILKGDINLDEINTNWDKFLTELSNVKPSVSNALEDCEIGQLAGNRLEIKMVNGNNFNYRTLEKNKIIIEEYLQKFYGVPIKTAFLKTKSEKPKKDSTFKNEEQVVKTNKTTAKIIEMFDGEIIN
jgi:DNA polymerase-3 subunit gamma/tau